MTGTRVPLNDQEWILKSEQLAKEELERKALRDVLKEEKDEWSDRKKELDLQIDIKSNLIERLAQDVDSRTQEIDAQATLPMGEPQAEEEPPPEEPE